MNTHRRRTQKRRKFSDPGWREVKYKKKKLEGRKKQRSVGKNLQKSQVKSKVRVDGQ